MRDMNIVFNNTVKLVAKFVCKNTIVLYQVQLQTGQSGYVRRDVLDIILQKYNIELTNRSDIQRINVAETDSGFCILVNGSLSDTYIRDSGMDFARFIDHLLSEGLRTEKSLGLLKKWLKEEKFIRLEDSQDKGFEAYLCISQGSKLAPTIDVMHNMGIATKCSFYILSSDVKVFGLGYNDVNIVGSMTLREGQDNMGKLINMRVVPDNTGWYLVESFKIDSAFLFTKVYSRMDISVELRRDYVHKFSHLPDKLCKAIGYIEPRIPYKKFGGIPLENKKATAEALAYYFSKENELIHERSDSFGYFKYENALSVGYIGNFSGLYISDKGVKDYVDKVFDKIYNKENPNVNDTFVSSTPSTQKSKDEFGLIDKIFNIFK